MATAARAAVAYGCGVSGMYRALVAHRVDRCFATCNHKLRQITSRSLESAVASYLPHPVIVTSSPLAGATRRTGVGGLRDQCRLRTGVNAKRMGGQGGAKSWSHWSFASFIEFMAQWYFGSFIESMAQLIVWFVYLFTAFVDN